MKYGMRYDNRSRHLNDFDEIFLVYDHPTVGIIEHIQKYKPEQRVILDVTGLSEDDFDKSKDYFSAAAEVHSNIALVGAIGQVRELEESGLPYFFPHIVSCWDELNGYIKLGVSDVYVGNEFAFNMTYIANVCRTAGVQVRAYANIAQTNCASAANTITQFYIRPEDVVLYEEYIDVIEFYGPLDRQDVLYEIYTKGQWLGDLSTLIIGLKEEVHNPIITGIFGTLRRDCGKRCSYSPSCNVCTRFVSISNTLKEAHNEVKADEASV